nr:unnamed protein product [Callosobruchus chinensis]
MYYVSIYSHPNNNIILCGQAVTINIVYVLQKRVLRLIFNINKRDPCKEIFKKYNLPTLPSIYILKSATFAFTYRTTLVRNDYTTRTGYDLCMAYNGSVRETATILLH